MKERTMERYIGFIKKDNFQQAMWQFDTARWISDFNKDDILKYLPLFIEKIKSFKARTDEYDHLLAEVKNGKLDELKKLLSEE